MYRSRRRAGTDPGGSWCPQTLPTTLRDPIPCPWEAAAELSVCWGLFPESPKLPSFLWGEGRRVKGLQLLERRRLSVWPQARVQRCSVQAQGQSGTARSSTVPGPQTGEVERAFSVGWTGDACPSPAPQTCPAPLSLAFAYLFICWEGVH